MGRYYFCTQHDGAISDDESFTELPDDHAAWATATAAAAKFLKNADGSLKPNMEWRIDVQDAAKQPLYAVRIIPECYAIDDNDDPEERLQKMLSDALRDSIGEHADRLPS